MVKRIALFLGFLVCLPALQSQSALWQRVRRHPDLQQLHEAPLSSAQQDAVRRSLRADPRLVGWQCSADDPSGEWLRSLSFQSLSLAANRNTILVEAVSGCARGGQGSNGAMWLVRFDSETAVFLATPKMSFNGWLYGLPHTTSHGYRDIVVGWHMSAFESELSYFRFNGRSYRRISSATELFDENGNGTIESRPVLK